MSEDSNLDSKSFHTENSDDIHAENPVETNNIGNPGVACLISSVIGFFGYYSWCRFLRESLGESFGIADFIVQTAIIMSYVAPLFVGGLLTQAKSRLFKSLGWFVMGFGFGGGIRLALTFVGSFGPYR